MPTVIVDGVEVELAPGEKLNGIQAAARAGVEIPHYCWHAGLSVVASCRMCLVETGTKNAETGAVQMMPKLVPACQTPASPNTVFVTTSPKIEQARAMVQEDLLLDHPIDCPICDKAGECRLQDYHFSHGQQSRRTDIQPFTSRRREMGETVALFVDRCVMCTRCVRFCREVSGTSELLVSNRGAHEEIDVFPGYPLANKLSGNVVDLCPVGALGDKDFLYQQRVWFMKKHDGICTGCSTGCSVTVEENQDHVYRLKPRTNLSVNGYWMCDEGRYGYHHVHSEKRLTQPERKGQAGYANIEWLAALKEIDVALRASGRLAASLSPHLTVEEAYLLAKYVRGIDPDALLVLGPVPVEGVDEKFKSGFTIRAEKCPNRVGVAQIVQHFMGREAGFEELLEGVESGAAQGVWISGGYKTDWIDVAAAAKLAKAKTLIVQDLFASPAWEAATFRLPGASFAERDGCYVNHAGRLQHAEWAVRPPVGVRVEGGVYWQLLAMPGLYKSRKAMQEIADTAAYFAAAADEIPEDGVDLTAKPAAETVAPAGS